MCVIPIPKAGPFGEDGEWQTHRTFREQFIKVAAESNLDEYLCEEIVDDVVVVLSIMQHVILRA